MMDRNSIEQVEKLLPYRSATSTARLAGKTTFGTIRDIAYTLFKPAPQHA